MPRVLPGASFGASFDASFEIKETMLGRLPYKLTKSLSFLAPIMGNEELLPGAFSAVDGARQGQTGPVRWIKSDI